MEPDQQELNCKNSPLVIVKSHWLRFVEPFCDVGEIFEIPRYRIELLLQLFKKTEWKGQQWEPNSDLFP